MLNNLFDLKDKVIVVTGACGLLGRSHCEAIAQAGGIPVILDLNKDKAQNLAESISRKFSVNASGYSVDITDEDQIRENSDYLIYKYSKIDGLINNAANNPKVENSYGENFSRLENFPLEIWQKDLSVGLTGAFLCCKYYGSRIYDNKVGGVILNISSDLGLVAPDQRLYKTLKIPVDQQPVKPVTYSVIKSGLIGLTRYMATYWPEKVRCNALCPGGVEAGQSEAFLKMVKDRIPMSRMASVDEYQGAVIFLLSKSSAYMNGSILSMDGGRTCW
jgi:NAD(P)-dependent dehydrogenase (short-subunit alcohol dehydrogenase family)